MRRHADLAAAVLLSAALVCAPAQAAAQADKVAQAGSKHIDIPRVDAAPTLDDYRGGSGPGVAVSQFLQREPGDLVPVSESTTAFLSYGPDSLYVAFVCKAANPSSIRAHLGKRESVFGDDWVAVFLDPFQERQRAYMFFSNPIGIQADGVTSETSGDDMSFDAVWTTSAHRTADGYVALLAIPFKSLRFPSGTDPGGWGIGLARAIPTHSETSFWPGITRRVNGFTSQFAVMDGIRGVSPGRNIQFIPYGTFAGARVLDEDTGERSSHDDFRGGVDAKMVVRDKLTIDATVNPDFSQVESDEPQVTINQRFEVFFPEKRPFFLENADYFQTPITLFFSRRVRDPQLGARVTGRLGRWALGALTMDDRQPGRAADRTSAAFGDRTINTVVRARRDYANQSNFGLLLTSREFGGSSNRVASADGRVRFNPRWIADGQALVTKNTPLAGASETGGGLWLGLHRSGRKFSSDLMYQDLSPGVRAPLGFVPRTDIRRIEEFGAIRWYPKDRRITSLGPNIYMQGTWDHDRTLQEWTVRFPFNMQLGQTFLFARHAQMMERFQGVDYREYENVANIYSTVISWLTFSAGYSAGTRPNFFPAPGVAPSLADFTDASLGLTFRPSSRLLIDETYLYSRLAQPTSSIFNNHIVRSRVNYQFNRALSLRGILDYNAILPNEAQVQLERRKHLTADLLVTYLLHPGTAVYVGYTDGYDNLRRDPIGGELRLGGGPTLSTGRQVFIKSSYLFRF
jgi:uncharacterized protein DUF5916